MWLPLSTSRLSLWCHSHHCLIVVVSVFLWCHMCAARSLQMVVQGKLHPWDASTWGCLYAGAKECFYLTLPYALLSLLAGQNRGGELLPMFCFKVSSQKPACCGSVQPFNQCVVVLAMFVFISLPAAIFPKRAEFLASCQGILVSSPRGDI